MGYTHYWYREKTIPKVQFKAIALDFRRLLPALEKAGVKLAGPLGKGLAEINLNIVAFNGPVDCGHPEGYELRIPWPAPNAGGVFSGDAVSGTWAGGAVVATRCCDGDCSCESFVFPRVYVPPAWHEPEPNGLWFEFCKPGFKPYDIAVTAFLVIAKHHLGDHIIVATDGEDAHWFDGRMFCMTELGYGLEYHVRAGELATQ